MFLLLLQAILFYVPRWLWKNWEAGKIHALMMDLDIGVVQDVEKRQKKRLLLDYLADNLKHHNWWAYRYFFCEFLALVNIIGKEKLPRFILLGRYNSSSLAASRFLNDVRGLKWFSLSIYPL